MVKFKVKETEKIRNFFLPEGQNPLVQKSNAFLVSFTGEAKK